MPTITPRKTRNFMSHPFATVEPLLNLLKNELHLSEAEIATAIGYSSPSYFAVLRKEDKIPQVAMFALKGLIAEKSGVISKTLSAKPVSGLPVDFDEIELLFDACRRSRKVVPVAADAYKKLQGKLAQQMATLSE